MGVIIALIALGLLGGVFLHDWNPWINSLLFAVAIGFALLIVVGGRTVAGPLADLLGGAGLVVLGVGALVLKACAVAKGHRNRGP